MIMCIGSYTNTHYTHRLINKMERSASCVVNWAHKVKEVNNKAVWDCFTFPGFYSPREMTNEGHVFSDEITRTLSIQTLSASGWQLGWKVVNRNKLPWGIGIVWAICKEAKATSTIAIKVTVYTRAHRKEGKCVGNSSSPGSLELMQ